MEEEKKERKESEGDGQKRVLLTNQKNKLNKNKKRERERTRLRRAVVARKLHRYSVFCWEDIVIIIYFRDKFWEFSSPLCL